MEIAGGTADGAAGSCSAASARSIAARKALGSPRWPPSAFVKLRPDVDEPEPDKSRAREGSCRRGERAERGDREGRGRAWEGVGWPSVPPIVPVEARAKSASVSRVSRGEGGLMQAWRAGGERG